MRILFDQGVPLPLKSWLTSHEVETARQRGWSELLNGELLAAVQGARFDLFITTDQNPSPAGSQSICNCGARVDGSELAALEPFASEIATAVDKIQPRQYVEWSPV
jgi:hypothetical protein